MKKFFLSLAFVSALLCGCQKINDLESRMNTVETDIASLKSDVAKLQAAVSGNYAVSSFKATSDGYVLTLTDGSTINLYNGAPGAAGATGAQGPQGENGKDGDAFFESVTAADGLLTIVLVDGSVYTLPLFDALSSLTSLVFLPEYSDGLATLAAVDGGDVGIIKMAYLISPSSVVKDMQDNEDDYDIKVLAAGAKTRADEYTEFPTFWVVTDDGVLSLFADVSGSSTSSRFAIRISNKAGNSIVSDFVGAAIKTIGVLYGGVTYAAYEMQDGKVWMKENLRYIPEGYTPSSDLKNVTAGVYMPVVLNEAHTAVEFGTADDAARQGYLYQSEVALGLKVGDITTAEQAQALEGTRGICPEGWHIPTADDILGLVGKAVSPLTTNEDAPYYDKVKKNATFDLLNADGFNAAAWGAVSIIDNTKTAGTLMGWLKACPDVIGSGYLCGSTYAGVTYNTKDDPESGIKNVQFYGFMPMANNGTFNGAKLSYRVAASVRCVKD